MAEQKALYHQVQPGQVFHRGKCKAGFPRKGLMWMEYVRETGNLCKCVKQINYGNTRAEGGFYTISPSSKVWLTGEKKGAR